MLFPLTEQSGNGNFAVVRKPSFPCPWDLRNRLFFWGSSLCCSLDLLLTVLFGKLLDEQKKLCHKRKVSAGPPKKPGVRVVSCHLLYDICTILSLIVLSKNNSKNKTKKKKIYQPLFPLNKKFSTREDWQENCTWFLFASPTGFIIKWKQLTDQSCLTIFLPRILTWGWTLETDNQDV